MLVVIVCMAAIVATHDRLSPTWDEGNHIAAAMELLQDGEYTLQSENPPVARVVVALGPYLAGSRLPAEGRSRMDDHLSTHLPQFAKVKVYAGEDEDGDPVLVAPNRPITVRDITRHTAGFVYGRGDDPVARMYAEVDPANRSNTLAEMGEKMGALPLAFHPGDAWRYGLAVDVQALLVERLSGTAYEQYAREHVLEPLGMNETMSYVPPELQGRRAAEYERSDDGRLTRTPDDIAFGWSNAEWPMDPGGSGWTATIDDYAKFARMLLNEGEFGEIFWDGRDSTLFWVDPTNDLTAVLFVQLIPFDPIGLRRSFRRAVYDAIGGLSTER